MPISVERSLLIIVVCGLVVFTTRAIPFVLFSGKKEIPEIVDNLEKMKIFREDLWMSEAKQLWECLLFTA